MDEDEWKKKTQKLTQQLIEFLTNELQSSSSIIINELESSSVDEEGGDDIRSMSYTQLQEYESELEEKLQKVREEKDMRYQKKAHCVICKINLKNVCILGCNHLDLCQECEECCISKCCQTCLKPYQKILIIKR